jgi:hypothetical protein
MRTLADNLRANLRGTDQTLWDYCVRYIAWTWNRIPRPRYNRHPIFNGLAPKDVLAKRKLKALNLHKLSSPTATWDVNAPPQDSLLSNGTPFTSNSESDPLRSVASAKHFSLHHNRPFEDNKNFLLNIQGKTPLNLNSPVSGTNHTRNRKALSVLNQNFRGSFVGKASFERCVEGTPKDYLARRATFMPQKETSLIGILHPPPGSFIDSTPEKYPDRLLREALCCKITGEHAETLHRALYGGVLSVNSPDNCGFKRFRVSKDEYGSHSRSILKRRKLISNNLTTISKPVVMSSAERTTSKYRENSTQCDPGVSSSLDGNLSKPSILDGPKGAENREDRNGPALAEPILDGQYAESRVNSAGATSYEGGRPDAFRWADYFKPFGVLAYVLREPREQLKKLEEKFAKAIFLGFSASNSSWLFSVWKTHEGTFEGERFFRNRI